MQAEPLATGGQQQLEPAEIIGEDCRFLGFHVSGTCLRFLYEREVPTVEQLRLVMTHASGAARAHGLLPVSMSHLRSPNESHL